MLENESIRDEISEMFREIMNDDRQATPDRLRAAELLGLAWEVLPGVEG